MLKQSYNRRKSEISGLLVKQHLKKLDILQEEVGILSKVQKIAKKWDEKFRLQTVKYLQRENHKQNYKNFEQVLHKI